MELDILEPHLFSHLVDIVGLFVDKDSNEIRFALACWRLHKAIACLQDRTNLLQAR